MLLKSKNNSLTFENRTKSYSENIAKAQWYVIPDISFLSTHGGTCSDIETQKSYLSKLLKENSIDEQQFKKDVQMIMERKHNKINALVSGVILVHLH